MEERKFREKNELEKKLKEDEYRNLEKEKKENEKENEEKIFLLISLKEFEDNYIDVNYRQICLRFD
jgi:hypothetical protein